MVRLKKRAKISQRRNLQSEKKERKIFLIRYREWMREKEENFRHSSSSFSLGRKRKEKKKRMKKKKKIVGIAEREEEKGKWGCLWGSFSFSYSF